MKNSLSMAKKIKEDMKVTLSEIKSNPQEINIEGKEAGIQTNDLEHTDKTSIQLEQKYK